MDVGRVSSSIQPLWCLPLPNPRPSSLSLLPVSYLEDIHRLFNKPWTQIVISKTNFHFENSQCHILSLGRIKRWHEKYVREMWKIHKTEWTEIRGWEDIFERVTSHLSRDSTRWAGRTQGEPVHGCSSYHRHGHQHHIKHADSYKNKNWALNQHDVVPLFRHRDILKDEELLLRLLLSADVELVHVPATWSRLGLGQGRPGDSFLMSLSFYWRCDERVPGSLQNPGSLLRALFDLDHLHHLHASHHGDGRRCPKVTLSFMFLSLILASIAAN